jgi:hypothetical protein
MIMQVSSLRITTIVGLVTVVVSAAGSTAMAQERSVHPHWSNSRVWTHPGGSRNLYNYSATPNSPVGNYRGQWRNFYNSGNDSLRPDPFLRGPNPDFCIECTWPEGSPTYHGDNGP